MGWYILAVAGFALGFDQHRHSLLNAAPRLDPPHLQIVFDITAWISGVACLGWLVAGFFIGTWWLPFAAMAIGTATNFYGRTAIPLGGALLGSIGGAAAGVVGGAAVFLEL